MFVFSHVRTCLLSRLPVEASAVVSLQDDGASFLALLTPIPKDLLPAMAGGGTREEQNTQNDFWL